MEKPGILSAFERHYNNIFERKRKNLEDKINIYILVDFDTIGEYKEDKFNWLPGAFDTMNLLADRYEDSIIHVYINHSDINQIKKVNDWFRKHRMLFDITGDPIAIGIYDIIISNKSGFNYTDFPAIKEFLSKLEK